MSAVNVDWISERFGDGAVTDGWVGPQAEPNWRGELQAAAGCENGCMTWATREDIWVGNIPCPKGHGSAAW